ncbi:MAG TPA: SPFH domain-containing protein [Gemmatimonadaceae bacterium]|nr:SPFH domain-containing protein [Gemmatimonadaceae bacterium]
MSQSNVFFLLQAGVADIPLGAIVGVLGGIVLFSLLLLFVSRYKRCPANRVLVVSGRVGGGESAKCISGGATFVWPVFQEFAFLSLEPMQIEIPLRDALSYENIRVAVPSVFTVAIGTESEVRQNAAIRLLDLGHEQIKRQAQDIIFGQLRQVIASMKIEEINRDRDAFLNRVQTSLEPELKKIGLVLINVNITDLRDDSGYIEAIGKKAAATAVQQARGDVAEQEKLGEVRVAEAERERIVQVANATKFREIGTREAEREQAVRVAELLKEQTIGEQRAAFEREAQVKDAERERRVRVAEAEAKAIEGEAGSQAHIVATRAQLQLREAEAYQLAETKKREAEAAVQEAQNRALARAALADAERVEAERRAEVEAPAKADKARTIVEAEAEAERRILGAKADAQAIFLKLEAEARGQYEILAKKGEGLQRVVEACGGSTQAFQLLMLEHLDTLAHTSAKAISNIKFDKVVVWEGGANQQSGAAGFLQNMARTMPPMMNVLRDIAGVELPGYFGELKADVPVEKQVAHDGAAVAAPPGALASSLAADGSAKAGKQSPADR